VKQETRKLKIRKSEGWEIVDQHEESRNLLRVGRLLTSDGEVIDCREKEYVVSLFSLSAPSGPLVRIQKHMIYVGVHFSLQSSSVDFYT